MLKRSRRRLRIVAIRKRISERVSRSASVQEVTIGTRPVLSAELLGSDGCDPGSASQDDRAGAGLDRQIAQVCGDQDAGTARPGVRDDFLGGLDADRVDAVEGLIQKKYLGLVERRQDNRHPSAHAVAEAGGDPVRYVTELESLEQVAGSRLPARPEPSQLSGELQVLPGRGARHEATNVGAVAAAALGGHQISAQVVARNLHDAAGRRDHSCEDPHRRGLPGPVAAQQGRGLPRVCPEVDSEHCIDRSEPHVQGTYVDERHTATLGMGSRCHLGVESGVVGHRLSLIDPAGFGGETGQRGKDSSLSAISRRRGVGREAVAVRLGELVGPPHERLQPDLTGRALVAGHELGGPAGQGREADAHDRADVGRRSGLDDALLEALRGLESLSEEHPVLDVLQRQLLLGHREGFGKTGPQPRAPAVDVLVEAGALKPGRSVKREHGVDDLLRRMRRVRRTSGLDRVLGRLLDLLHQLEIELVAELKGADRVTGLGRRAFQRHRVHTLAEHRETFVDHRADDPRGVEAAAVVDDDRGLPDLLDDVVRLREGLVGGLLAADDLDQRHLVDRREEVQADEVLGAVHALGEPGDRKRRGVGAQEGVRIDVGQDLGEHLVLEGRVLEDGLDDEVATREVDSVGSRGDPAEQLDLLLLGRLAPGDGLVEQLCAVGLALLGVLGGHVLENDVHAGPRARVGDAGAHHAGAQHAHLDRLVRRDSRGSQRPGVDRLEVEEERLDHVLRLLAGGQLGQVARLDPRCGVEVDLGALDRAGQDGSGRVVVRSLALLTQQRREHRQELGELGGARVPPGIRKPSRSHGFLAASASSLFATIHAFAAGISSSAATISSISPLAWAADGWNRVPGSRTSMSAGWMPSMRTTRVTPPPPGRSPSCDSGRPMS